MNYEDFRGNIGMRGMGIGVGEELWVTFLPTEHVNIYPTDGAERYNAPWVLAEPGTKIIIEQEG